MQNRHALSYLRYRVVVQCPLGSRDQPSQHSNSLLYIDSEAQKDQSGGSSLNLQVRGIIVGSPGGSILPFGTKAFRPAEHKVTGTGSKNFTSGSLGVTMCVATPISTSLFLNP